jgi:hypothetical protein
LAEADERLRARANRIPRTGTTEHQRTTKPEPVQIGLLGPDWPVLAIRHWDSFEVTIDAKPYDLTFDLTFSNDDLFGGSRTRIWQRIVNRPARGLIDRIRRDEHDLRRATSDLEQAERYAGKPFPDQHQLDDLRGRLAQVEHQLMPTPDEVAPASIDPDGPANGSVTARASSSRPDPTIEL